MSSTPRALRYVGVALFLALAGMWLMPAFVLNLAALSLRDLSIDLSDEPAAVPAPRMSRLPWGLRLLTVVRPGSRVQTDATWIAARAARLLE